MILTSRCTDCPAVSCSQTMAIHATKLQFSFVPLLLSDQATIPVKSRIEVCQSRFVSSGIPQWRLSCHVLRELIYFNITDISQVCIASTWLPQFCIVCDTNWIWSRAMIRGHGILKVLLKETDDLFALLFLMISWARCKNSYLFTYFDLYIYFQIDQMFFE
jgi:hypothetical protein